VAAANVRFWHKTDQLDRAASRRIIGSRNQVNV